MIKLWKSVIYKIVHHRNPGVLRICEMCEKKKKKEQFEQQFFPFTKTTRGIFYRNSNFREWGKLRSTIPYLRFHLIPRACLAIQK